MSDSPDKPRSTDVEEYFAKAGEKAKVGQKAKGRNVSIFSEEAVGTDKVALGQKAVVSEEPAVIEQSRPGDKGTKARGIWSWAFRIMAGFEVAIICLLMLFVPTY